MPHLCLEAPSHKPWQYRIWGVYTWQMTAHAFATALFALPIIAAQYNCEFLESVLYGERQANLPIYLGSPCWFTLVKGMCAGYSPPAPRSILCSSCPRSQQVILYVSAGLLSPLSSGRFGQWISWTKDWWLWRERRQRTYSLWFLSCFYNLHGAPLDGISSCVALLLARPGTEMR